MIGKKAAVDIDQRSDLSFTFTHIFRCLLVGPSSSGKSTLLLKIFKNMHNFLPQKYELIVYCYPARGMTEIRKQYVSELEKFVPELETHEGLPSNEDIMNAEGLKLLIIDDLYYEAVNSFDFMNFCIHGSHMSNTSFFMTCQNLYINSKYKSTIIRQITDFIIYPFVGDHLMLSHLSKQLTGDSKFLPRCMEWLKENFKDPYERVIWLNLNVANKTMPDQFRIRSNFLSSPIIAFQKVKTS